MPAFPFDTVAFDLDGTLADTGPDLAATLNHVLAMLGRAPVPVDSVRHLVGHGARALLRCGLAATGESSGELVERGFPIYLEDYAANICVGTRLYPGLEDALDALTERGVALAICTNKQEDLTRRLLDALGWRDRFQAVVGGDTLPVRKPDPAPHSSKRSPEPAAAAPHSSAIRSPTPTPPGRPASPSSPSASASRTGRPASSGPMR